MLGRTHASKLKGAIAHGRVRGERRRASWAVRVGASTTGREGWWWWEGAVECVDGETGGDYVMAADARGAVELCAKGVRTRARPRTTHEEAMRAIQWLAVTCAKLKIGTHDRPDQDDVDATVLGALVGAVSSRAAGPRDPAGDAGRGRTRPPRSLPPFSPSRQPSVAGSALRARRTRRIVWALTRPPRAATRARQVMRRSLLTSRAT